MYKNFLVTCLLLFTYNISFSQEKIQQSIGVDIQNDRTFELMGRKLEVNVDGFPKKIQSFYDDNNVLNLKPIDLLYEPMHFHFFTSAKLQEKLNPNQFRILSKTADSVVWEASSLSDQISMLVHAKLLNTGVVKYHVNIKPLNDIEFSAINFHVPMNKNISTQLVGLGNAGKRPDTVKWASSPKNLLAGPVWIGNDQVGLYYHQLKSNNVGKNWSNLAATQMQINIKGSSMLMDVHSENIMMTSRDELNYDFILVLTPLSLKENTKTLKKRFKKYDKLSSKY